MCHLNGDHERAARWLEQQSELGAKNEDYLSWKEFTVATCW